MNRKPVKCVNCGKIFLRSINRVNETAKNNWLSFCSQECLKNFKNKQKALICENPSCAKQFKRAPNAISKHNYCSRSCAITVNNKKFPKRKSKIKLCPTCGKKFTGQRKYCSMKCIPSYLKFSRDQIIQKIKSFYEKNNRIPLKCEFHHYRSARRQFGTWNKAIKASGLTPNPVLFSRKFIANDGHKCDSLSEKIIDDWLSARKIAHKINVPYPKNKKLTVDFLIKNNWIEFFGLSGKLDKYDRQKKRKIRLAKKLQLKFIEIYPCHLFPKNKLDQLLGFLVNV